MRLLSTVVVTVPILTVLLLDNVVVDCRTLRSRRQAPANDFFGFGPLIRTFMARVQPLIATASRQSTRTLNTAAQLAPAFIPVKDRNGQLNNLPFCQSQASTGICPFMLCTMEGLKESPNMDNLQLLTQVMSDPKLRGSVADSPEVIDMFCQSSNVQKGACTGFKTLIKVLDKVMTLSEKKRGLNRRFKRSNERDKNNDGCDDYYEYGGGRCGLRISAEDTSSSRQLEPQGDKKVWLEPVDIDGSGEDPIDFEEFLEEGPSISTDDYYGLIEEQLEKVEETSHVDVEGLKKSKAIFPVRGAKSPKSFARCSKYLNPSTRRQLAFFSLFKV